jgi:hypothetical protein
LKATIADYVKGPFTFCHPLNNLRPIQSSYSASTLLQGLNDAPCFCFSMLSVRIGQFPFPFPLECCRDGLWVEKPFDCSPAYIIGIRSFIRACNNISSPTLPCMLPHVTCRLHIPFVQVSPDPARLLLACLCTAQEYVASAAINIFNVWDRLEECINRGCPILGQLVCCIPYSLALFMCMTIAD